MAEETTALQSIREEVASAITRLSSPDGQVFDVKAELRDNLYPLLGMLVDAAEADADEVDSLAEAVDMLIDQDSDVLHPETAKQFLGLLEVGKMMAAELEKLMPKLKDDLAARSRCKAIIKAWRAGEETVRAIVTEITVVDDGDGDGEGEGEGEADPQPGDPLPGEVVAANDGDVTDKEQG